jgi:hypothetical protein
MGCGENSKKGNEERAGSLFPSPRQFCPKGGDMLITILLIVLLISLIGSVPAWPYSRGWGYYPSGGLGLVLLILLVLLLMGRI